MAIPLRRDNGEINPWIIAFTVMLATFMEVLDTSVANVALPHIAGSMSATVDETTWVLTSYLVSNAIVLPLTGWLSSVFGRKRFYMACVFLFTVSSTMCGLAPSLNLLILFRVLQGVGGGALQPISQAVLAETFPPHKRGMAMAVYGMGVVFAPVVGPTLGGWITDNFTWRWIFLINIPVGMLSLFMTSMLIKDPPYLKRVKGLGIDYMGLGLLTVGLAALEIFLDEGQREDWFSSNLIVVALVAAVICLVAVVVWELRQKNPVVDFRLLKERNFAVSTGTMFMLGFVLYGSTMLLPVFLQQLLGYTATQSGMVLSPGGIIILFLMPVVGFLVSKVQARWLVIFGLFISAVGLWDMSRFNLQVDYYHATLSRIVQSAGLAFLFVPINSMAFNFIPKDRTSYATGLINLARNVGGSAGIAMTTTLLSRRSQYHQSVLVSHLTPGDPAYESMLEGARQMLMAKGADAVQALQQAQAMLYGMVQREAMMMSFLDAFYILAILFVALIPLMFIMKKTRPQKAPAAAH